MSCYVIIYTVNHLASRTKKCLDFLIIISSDLHILMAYFSPYLCNERTPLFFINANPDLICLVELLASVVDQL